MIWVIQALSGAQAIKLVVKQASLAVVHIWPKNSYLVGRAISLSKFCEVFF